MNNNRVLLQTCLQHHKGVILIKGLLNCHHFQYHLHDQFSWGVSPFLLLAERQLFLGGDTKQHPQTKIIPGRKIEDKMDAKSLQSFPCSIRCNPPPQQKKVPIDYPAWIVVADSAVDSNMFCKSQLFQDRTESHPKRC